jgi:hypothetical protein
MAPVTEQQPSGSSLAHLVAADAADEELLCVLPSLP